MDIGDPPTVSGMGLYDLVGPVFVRSKTEGSELPHLTLHLGCCVRDLAGALLVWGMGENCRRDGAWQPPGSRPLICRKRGARAASTGAVSPVGGASLLLPGPQDAAWLRGDGRPGCSPETWAERTPKLSAAAGLSAVRRCFTLCDFRRKLGASQGPSVLVVVARSTLLVPGSQGQLAPCGETLCSCRT